MTRTTKSQSNAGTAATVKIIVPQHVSNFKVTSEDETTRLYLTIYQSAGVAWRGIVPLLLEAPHSTTGTLLRLMFKNCKLSTIPKKGLQQTKPVVGEERESDDLNSGFRSRTLRLSSNMAIPPRLEIFVQPPTISTLEPIFSSVVLRTEHTLLRLQTLAAWWATLGGGYFFCRRLHVSLQLAKQQQALALYVGNIHMARQCSVNEAYNLIYAGKFRSAKKVLKDLEDSIMAGETPDSVTLRQCQAARLLAKRLKMVYQRGLKEYNAKEIKPTLTRDDFQRIRIVAGYH